MFGSVASLLKLNNSFRQKNLITIYHSLIACHLNYGILVWGKSARKLSKIQKKAIRIATNSKFNAHTEPLFKSLKILKVENARKLQEFKFFYKFNNGTLPSNFMNGYIQFNDVHHRYGTRHNIDLVTPLFRH